LLHNLVIPITINIFAALKWKLNDHGDFKIDGKWIIEVGGRDKSFQQIADIPDSFVLADSMEFPIGHKLPLWIVGFIY